MDQHQIGALRAELRQFTGSEVAYVSPLFSRFRYTEGVYFLAERAGAYWLLDFIFSHQVIPAIKAERFQVWKIEVKEDYSATLTVEDGDGNQVKQYRIDLTDFPLEEFTLWFTDRTLLLPSEY
ncbi:MAG: hypothetical protein H6573_34410 [Lewinellaceae bacterium]|nr:hypothetical protein [Lewinellaceae bacterium]